MSIEKNGKFFLPLADFKHYELGKHSAYSVFTYFVVSEEEDEKGEGEYRICGDSDDEKKEGLEIEEIVFKKKSISINQY